MINCLNTNRTDRANRRAFTLVELLIVIVVIAILSSMVIMAFTTTMTSARDVHTRATITKLHDLIMQKYESYSTRRVPLPTFPPGTPRATIARARIDGLRDLMRMEMPDRFTDFTLDTEANPFKGSLNSSKKSNMSGILAPSMTNHYRTVFSASSKNGPNESAECLYMIIAYGLRDPEALERFSESEIGDTDGDGLPEFIDAWGRAISFIRWPALYPSEIQMPGLGNNYPDNPHDTNDPKYVAFTTYLTTLANASHDPVDSLMLERSYVQGNPPTTPHQFPAYNIIPLIFSGGPDQIPDVDEVDVSGRASTLANKPFQSKMPGAPYDRDSDGQKNWTDNITNHDLLVP